MGRAAFYDLLCKSKSITASGLFFVALVVSGSVLSMQDGGLLSLQAPLLVTIHTVHKVAPVLTLVAAGLSLSLLAGARAA